jgi:hypothetical protein
MEWRKQGVWPQMDLHLYLCFALVNRIIPGSFLKLFEPQFPLLFNRYKNNCSITFQRLDEMYTLQSRHFVFFFFSFCLHPRGNSNSTFTVTFLHAQPWDMYLRLFFWGPWASNMVLWCLVYPYTVRQWVVTRLSQTPLPNNLLFPI